MPDPETRALRELLRRGAFRVKMRRRVKSRLHALLDRLPRKWPPLGAGLRPPQARVAKVA